MIDRWYGITCDGCGAPSEILPTVVDARDAAKREGWAVALRGGRDLCPKCREREGQS